jgi:RAC serine/threonine-protein kinase
MIVMYVFIVILLFIYLQIEAPFKPVITNEIDTANFDEDFTKEEPTLTPPDTDDPQAGVGENVHFQDFTFAPEKGTNF